MLKKLMWCWIIHPSFGIRLSIRNYDCTVHARCLRIIMKNWKTDIILDTTLAFRNVQLIRSGKGNIFYQRMKQYVILWHRFYILNKILYDYIVLCIIFSKLVTVSLIYRSFSFVCFLTLRLVCLCVVSWYFICILNCFKTMNTNNKKTKK